MVKRRYIKTIFKTLTENISRFLIMCFIVMLGVSFVSGLGTLASSLTDSINDYYQENKGLDFILKSKKQTGFTEKEIEEMEENYNIQYIKKITSIDDKDTRVIISDLSDDSFHKMEIIKGRKIKNANEIIVDQISDRKLNETVEVLGEKFKIVGIIKNLSYYTMEQEQTMEEKHLDYIYYLDTNYYQNPIKYLTTDLYVKFDNQKISNNIFSDNYEKEMQKKKKQIKKDHKDLVVLSLEENLSYTLIKSYGEKIELVAAIFPLFFILVSALVVYSTISRLIEEERAIIGCYRSLGISKIAIILKYVLFTFSMCLIGSIIGFLIGIDLLPTVIYPAYDALFYMPKMTDYRVIMPGVMTGMIMLVVLTLITIYSAWREMKGAPCQLLRPKSPKVGKKILLERITLVWKRLPFKYKSSFRNIFRYKVNLVMTILSVAGSTALTFAGFGLYAIAISPETTEIPKSMANSFSLISTVIIAFAAILCILVIFNITNMNIGERKREIATLRVLGYQQKEVSFYIYREINITTIIGVLFGIPFGYLLLNFLFEFLEFGDIKNVNWYYYMITMVMSIIFVLLAEILLNKKIHKVDMNGSLKSNE